MDLLTLMCLSGGGLCGNQNQMMNVMLMQNIQNLENRLSTQAAELTALRTDVNALNQSINDMAQSVNSAATAIANAFGSSCTSSSSTIPAARVRVI